MDDLVYGTVLLSTVNVLVLGFPIVVCEEVLVSDSADIGVTRGFDGRAYEAGFMLLSVDGKGTEKFLGLVQGFFDGKGPFNPVDRGVDFFLPGEL